MSPNGSGDAKTVVSDSWSTDLATQWLLDCKHEMEIDVEYREFRPNHYPIEARQIADIAFLKIKRMPPNPSCLRKSCNVRT